MGRWRDRRLAGLTAVVLLAVAMTSSVAVARDEDSRWLVVRNRAGAELARVVLPPSDQFSLRYRNSVYESLAEERFSVVVDQLRLDELAADELAVLEEYYTATGAMRGGASDLEWRVAVIRPPITLPLLIQATALGQRTLRTADSAIALWRLVAGTDDTLVILSVEGTR